MASISNKVKERFIVGIKRFQSILSAAKARDVNESDTVTIVNDLLAYVLGYDKYSEITSEFVIRGTYVDLAIKIEGQLQMLIEVKAIGLDLKEAFIKQAVDYGANQGIEWVILTNGVIWQIYRISFKQPIEQELVLEINMLNLNPKKEEDLEALYMISKEGLGKSMLGDYHSQRQALSRYFIGAMLLTDSVLDVLRRELRRISPDVKIDSEQIKGVLIQEILKREVIEGDKADEARKKIMRVMGRVARKSGVTGISHGGNGKEEIREVGAAVDLAVVEPVNEFGSKVDAQL